ncbi:MULTISPECIES: SigE family RNA polymerase sigma factor [Kitasatospora]|uniref:SigE family RNA polymerase sigma factor n=1 Tax=Kitasatospora TaxID=2063 RepID=UPI000C713ACB|nr:SigE family RNA polymerase sigma factor [Kitasatospora sp. GP30]MDH6138843.1 RNA polymerase sigma-70 factor (sigma-E family) [Kitasatospora sp. GP30]
MKRTSSSGEAPRQPDFREFAAARGPQLVRTAFLLTGGDAHLAEDLAQEALARMFARWRRLRRLDNPAAYAQTVLVNVFLTHRRRRSSSEQVTAGFSEAAAPEGAPELRLTLLAALRELPPQDRAVLVLRYWEDRSAEETAELLRLSASGVRTRCSRALARLRAVLGDELTQLAEH